MSTARTTLALLVHAALGGCLISTTASDGGSSSEGGGETTTTSSSSTTLATTTTAGETSSESSTTTSIDTCGFIPMCEDASTGDEPPYTCDLWADDPCGEGYKCAPWANDGGWVWNTELCTPLFDRPRAVGEPCQLGASPGAGLDDCVEGATCLWVDEGTELGTCVALCSGSPDAPVCDAPDTVCEVAFELVPLCLPTCDPLAPACPAGGACQPVVGGFACIDVLGPGAAVGEPCELAWACAAGSLCIGAEELSACEGSLGCCSEICDTTLTDPCGPDRVCTAISGDSNAGYCAAP